MPQVRFTELVDTPTHRFPEGCVVTLPPDIVQPFIDDGRAELMPETAVRTEAESPEKPARGRRKKADEQSESSE